MRKNSIKTNEYFFCKKYCLKIYYKMPSGKSTVLSIQQALIKRLNSDIYTLISEDQTTLIAADVSESDFMNLEFVTNNPSFNNSYMYLADIEVYLGEQNYPTEIYGLLPIVQQRIENSDALAFIDGLRSCHPFINGFQNGIDVGTLVDTLASMSSNTPDTYGVVKHFKLYIDPTPDQKRQEDEEQITPMKAGGLAGPVRIKLPIQGFKK